MSGYKLDMFRQVLPAIDDHDFGFYDRLSEDQRKGFAAPVILRFASAMKGNFADLNLIMTNSRANLDFFDLAAHPDLQWRMLASCGFRVNAQYQWIEMPARKRSTSAVHTFLGEYWPEANETELNLILNQFTRETFIGFLHECGLSPADEKTALDAYDRYTGHAPKKKASKPRKR